MLAQGIETRDPRLGMAGYRQNTSYAGRTSHRDREAMASLRNSSRRVVSWSSDCRCRTASARASRLWNRCPGRCVRRHAARLVPARQGELQGLLALREAGLLFLALQFDDACIPRGQGSLDADVAPGHHDDRHDQHASTTPTANTGALFRRTNFRSR